MRRKFVSLFLKLLSIICFLGVVAVVLLMANGYNYDFFTRNFKKTSIIDISSSNNIQASVYLDGKLVSDLMPDRIGGIIPAQYELMIIKSGFYPWKTKVKVFENLVSKVEHLFLVPEDIKSYLSELAQFEPKWDKIFTFNNNLLFLVNNNEKKLRILALNLDKLVQIKELDLPENNLINIEFIGDSFLLQFNDGNRYLGRLAVNYLDKVDLPVQFKFGGGYWYYANGKLFFRSKLNGEIDKIFPELKENVANLKFYSGFGDGVFSFEKNGTSSISLYVLENEKLNFLTGSLKAKPVVADQGLLFSTTFGEIFLYNGYLKMPTLLARYNKDIEVLNWVTSDHFLFKVNHQVYLTDIYFDNVYPVLADSDFEKLIVLNKHFYLLKANILSLLYFGK